jgi:hypothetical protein
VWKLKISAVNFNIMIFCVVVPCNLVPVLTLKRNFLVIVRVEKSSWILFYTITLILFFYIHSSYTVLLRCRGFIFSLDLYTIGRLLGRMIGPPQDLYLNTGQHKHRINPHTHQTSMPELGFEPTITASERTKRVLPKTALLPCPATLTLNKLN